MQSKKSKIDKVWRIIDLINWGEKYLKDKSIENSFEFAKTNVLGTLSLLEASKISWDLSSNNNIFYQDRRSLINIY